jgi:hypothetical protein
VLTKWLRRGANVLTLGRVKVGGRSGRPSGEDLPFLDLIASYDVIVMKHCFPASDVLEDSGSPDPTSDRKSLENYRAVYRPLRDLFDRYPRTMFLLWTIPPLHRLFEPSEGDKEGNAARATEFCRWMKTEFLAESGPHSNIYVWDFREIVMNPETNLLKYEYELSHKEPDSHPNKEANNLAGPMFAQCIVDSIQDFAARSGGLGRGAKIAFLHHSTGGNLYRYPDLGVATWFDQYNGANGTDYRIWDIAWYPSNGNMPVDYYRSWLAE